jgi:hypothetical protein
VEAGGKIYDTIEGFGADESVIRGKIARAEHDGVIMESSRKSALSGVEELDAGIS